MQKSSSLIALKEYKIQTHIPRIELLLASGRELELVGMMTMRYLTQEYITKCKSS